MITEPQARQIIRTYTAEYAETEPANITWLEQERAVEALTLQLSWYVGRVLSATHIQDVLEVWDELDSVNYGTHPDLKVNTALTVDNSAELVDQLQIRLEDEIGQALTLAGWTPNRAAIGHAA